MSQMEMELLEKVLGIIIACVFIYVVKPLVDSLVKKYQNNEVVKFTIQAIRAAQQELGEGVGSAKKAQVLEQVSEYVSSHTNLNLSADEINTIIEGSIKEAKKIYTEAE